MIPVVMSGGSGTRLWPVSRTQLPKQFCDLFGEPLQTMTLKRLSALGKPWVVTSRGLEALTKENAKASGLQMGELIFEPSGKNTAAAIALVCRVLELRGHVDEVVGIFPADHLVTKEKKFIEALQFAEGMALQGKIVTLGIRPSRAETGFGYIQNGPKSLSAQGDWQAFPVERFHEKPDLKKATEFVADARYCWNAGIFVFKASVMLDLLKTHEPAVWAPLQALKADLSNLEEIYSGIKSISIDYAVMEKIGGSGLLTCVPSEIGWSDVGSWDAVAEEKAQLGTAPQERTFLIDSKNVFTQTPNGKIVAVIGLDDIHVVDTGDVLVIMKKGHSQKVKNIVEELNRTSDPVLSEFPKKSL